MGMGTRSEQSKFGQIAVIARAKSRERGKIVWLGMVEWLLHISTALNPPMGRECPDVARVESQAVCPCLVCLLHFLQTSLK